MSNRVTLKIAEVIKETSDINTYKFRYDLQAKPGQFIMLSDLEGGEKPFSIADCTREYFSITVKRIGQFTTRLFNCQPGDLLSIRGPFGSSFFMSAGKVLLVGGGYGIPPLYFLAKELLKRGAEISVVNGANTSEDLLYCNLFQELGVEYHNISHCGKLSSKGTSVDLAHAAMKENKYDHIYAAGPEMMLKSLQSKITNESYDFLFERYMKCAIGICGNCTIDPLGIRLCVEGPVLPRRLVEKLTEFGYYHRDASGKRVYFSEK